MLLHTLIESGIAIPYDITHSAASAADPATGRTPLHMAALYSRFDAAVMLVMAGASPVEMDNNGWRPVDLATLSALRDYLVSVVAAQPYACISAF
jgi:ankyrin repeat protein